MKRELSRFGKKVRCLVVLNGERLKDLADYNNIPQSMVSDFIRVKSSHKHDRIIPIAFINSIVNRYDLNAEEAGELYELANYTNSNFEVKVTRCCECAYWDKSSKVCYHKKMHNGKRLFVCDDEFYCAFARPKESEQ